MKKETLEKQLDAMVKDSSITTEEVIAFRDENRDVLGGCEFDMVLKSMYMLKHYTEEALAEIKAAVA